MKVLLVGSGGREHTLAWKINQSPKVDKIFIAPGNAGTRLIGENVDIKADDINGLLSFALEEKIDLTIVGPEVPLVLGIVDRFRKMGLDIIGPSEEAALLEGSKAFAKEFMLRNNIPTAQYKEYYNVEEAKKDIGIFGYPMVIKADGLAAGKGVIIAKNKAEAIEGLDKLMVDKAFGSAGEKIVIEEFLDGIEASVLCFVDSNTIVPMETAQDYKRALDDDKGLNTGGMGSYSPSILFDDALKKKVKHKVLDPFVEGIKEDRMDFRGILFVGLMIKDDDLKVLEFNVRFGDPETQAIIPRLENDLVDIFEKMNQHKLNEVELQWKEEQAVCVILASGGYPVNYTKGYEINGLETLDLVFHAGTKALDDKIVTNGGRVLGVVSLDKSLDTARSKAYAKVDKIKFKDMQYRNDIAKI